MCLFITKRLREQKLENARLMRYDKLAFLINGLVDPYSWMSLFIVVGFFLCEYFTFIKGFKKSSKNGRKNIFAVASYRKKRQILLKFSVHWGGLIPFNMCFCNSFRMKQLLYLLFYSLDGVALLKWVLLLLVRDNWIL